MNQEREMMIEFAVLTFVGLLALAAILAYLPEATAQSISQVATPDASAVMTACAAPAQRSVRSE